MSQVGGEPVTFGLTPLEQTGRCPPWTGCYSLPLPTLSCVVLGATLWRPPGLREWLPSQRPQRRERRRRTESHTRTARERRGRDGSGGRRPAQSSKALDHREQDDDCDDDQEGDGLGPHPPIIPRDLGHPILKGSRTARGDGVRRPRPGNPSAGVRDLLLLARPPTACLLQLPIRGHGG